MMNYTLAKVGIDVITGKPDLGVLYGKPQSQANQTKQFMSCFEKLTGKERLEVSKEVLLTALVEESGFTTDNALHCITKSLRENMIYESRAGFYRRS
jgi:replicative DNA helicase Mcm